MAHLKILSTKCAEKSYSLYIRMNRIGIKQPTMVDLTYNPAKPNYIYIYIYSGFVDMFSSLSFYMLYSGSYHVTSGISVG